MLQRILIVEDDHTLAQTLHHSLSSKRTEVTVTHTVADALELVSEHNYDLVLIDRILPDGEGLEVAEYVGELYFSSRVLCLSEKKGSQDRIDGLQKGADDYLAKPFLLTELLLRINKLLQRDKKISQEAMIVGKVCLFRDSGIVKYDAVEKQLRRRETQILSCLFRHKNTVVTRDMIIDMVWGNSDITPTHITLDVYIRRIRILLGPHSKVIKTIRGFGYSAVDH